MRRMTSRCAGLVLAVGIYLLLVQAGAADKQPPPNKNDDKETLGKVALVGSAANVEAFPFYRCRYKVTKGRAASVENAIQGKYINVTSYECRLLVDRDKEFYEGLGTPTPPDKAGIPVPGKPGLSMVYAVTDAGRYLGGASKGIDYSPEMRLLTLRSQEKPDFGVTEPTPLSKLGLGKRGSLTHFSSKPEEYQQINEGMQEFEGKPVISVRFQNKVSLRLTAPTIGLDTIADRYFFDPARGYLPIRQWLLWDEKIKSITALTDVRECSNQRWFPERSVTIDYPDKGNLFGITEFKVLELDADEPPKASEFTMTVPAGTQVNDGADGRPRRHFRLKQDETIGIDDIPKLFTMLDEAEKDPHTDTAIPRPSPYRWLFWGAGGLGLVLATGGAWYLVRRRWPRRG